MKHAYSTSEFPPAPLILAPEASHYATSVRLARNSQARWLEAEGRDEFGLLPLVSSCVGKLHPCQDTAPLHWKRKEISECRGVFREEPATDEAASLCELAASAMYALLSARGGNSIGGSTASTSSLWSLSSSALPHCRSHGKWLVMGTQLAMKPRVGIV